MFTTAVTGIRTFNTSLASLGGVLLETCVVICAIIIATKVGGQGIQKEVRGVAITLGICALLLKGYTALTTGTMALF